MNCAWFVLLTGLLLSQVAIHGTAFSTKRIVCKQILRTGKISKIPDNFNNQNIHLRTTSWNKFASSPQTSNDFVKEFWKKEDIPNKLTISRIIGIPLFGLSFLLRMKATALLFFTAISVTDYLDGYLARKWNATSEFGAFLDPVADKLLIATAMILLSILYPTIFYVIPVAIILCREIAVSALREWMAERGKRNAVKVGLMGKIKTVLQMVAIILLLLVFPDHSADFDLCAVFGWSKPSIFVLGIVLLNVSAVAAILSGYEYFRAALSELLDKKK
jgi:CDP-diacylglycerol--glycerol-3-phosphate 3-phosphatidyltransferase